MKIINKSILSSFLLLFIFNSPIFSQEKSFGKLIKEAQGFEASFDYISAAISYDKAFTKKSKRKDIAYKAGDLYLKARDYSNAVKMLAVSKDTKIKNNKPGLRYAYALKQVGEYKQAREAFVNFQRSYEEKDKNDLIKIIDLETRGCSFAEKNKNIINENIIFSRLPWNVNSDKDELSPIIAPNNKLFFSSAISGKQEYYYVTKSNKEWVGPTKLDAENPAKTELRSGSFSPDGNRFYFSKIATDESGASVVSIFVTNYTDGNWSEAVRLPSFINVPKSNSTHPCVIMDNGTEVIFFSSDREGGKGGYDIWYTTVTIKDNVVNYNLPKNLGNRINGVSDEICPNYDISEATLFFSSNGLNNIGGFDVFRSKGSRTQWEIPRNMGFPINSSADDLFYTVDAKKRNGFLVSNRAFGAEKSSTLNDDIFYFEEKQIKLFLKGTITSNLDSSALFDVTAKLYTTKDSINTLISESKLDKPEFEFALDKNNLYTIEFSYPNHNSFVFQQSTANLSKEETVNQNIVLEKILPKETVAAIDSSLTEAGENPFYSIVPQRYNSPENAFHLPSTAVDASTGEPIAKGSPQYFAFVEADLIALKSPMRKLYWNELGVLTPLNPKAIVNAAPKNKRVKPENVAKIDNEAKSAIENKAKEAPKQDAVKKGYYAIQISAVKKFSASRFNDFTVKEFAAYELGFEKNANDVIRVLIVPKNRPHGLPGFNNKVEALEVLAKVKSRTSFYDAFLIER